MKKTKSLKWIDLIFVIGVGAFFLSCIATLYHTPRTLEPGQTELSSGYLQARSLEEFSETPIQLMAINARVGVVNNLDLGLEHTFDLSEGNEGMFKSLWGDFKWQLTNRQNELNKLTFSTGLLKGYLYDSEADFHITSLPFYFGYQASERLTPTFIYRYELTGEGKFIPNSLENPRHSFNLGLEYLLKEPNSQGWMPKLGVGVGLMNSLGGEDGDNVFIMHLGLKFTSPYR